MKKTDIEEIISTVTAEINSQYDEYLLEIGSNLNKWEEYVKNSNLSAADLIKLQYDHIISLRLTLFKKLFELEGCPDFILAQIFELCRQAPQDFEAKSVWAETIKKIKSEG